MAALMDAGEYLPLGGDAKVYVPGYKMGEIGHVQCLNTHCPLEYKVARIE